MRSILLATWTMLSAATIAAAQSTPAPPPVQGGLSLRTCAPVADATPTRFTVARPRPAKSWFRTTAERLRPSGHRMQVAGGLVPSPTIAAQAGALDPTVPAMAMASGDAYRRPIGAPRKPSVDLTTAPGGMRADCAVR